MAIDVAEFLSDLGLERYIEDFARQEIDAETLWHLEDADLREIGLPLGPRKKLLRAIESLTEERQLEHKAAIPAASGAGVHNYEHEPTLRRLLTVLFCDLVQSTELSQRLDPEELRDVLLGYQEACRVVIEGFDGFVSKYMGDGILAYFGYPVVHEDDAERAVRAGLGIVEAVSEFAKDAVAAKAPDLQVRVGIATGPTVVGDLIGEGAARENTVVGETPNLAARLQGLAKPNEVVVSATTQSLVGSSVVFDTMGTHTLKGFSDAVPVWRAKGLGLGGGRFERVAQEGFGRFVGRNAELETMMDAWRSIGADRTLVLDIYGEPGIGKSRLVHEFITRLPHPNSVLTGHCLSYGSGTTYLPMIDLLKRLFGISAGVESETWSEHIARGLDQLGLATGPNLPYLLNLFGSPTPELEAVDSSIIGLRIRAAIAEVIRAVAARSPTLIFINDCHWIDRSSEALLGEVIDMAPGNVLFLCTYRPEYVPPWRDRDRVREVGLSPLSASALRVLISAHLDGESLSDAAARRLLEQCNGNPLFAEELARHLRRSDGSPTAPTEKLDAPRGTLVPETLVGLLLQSVDALSAPSKRLLQVGSVVGRTFGTGIVREILPRQDLSTATEEVLHEGLIMHDPESGPGSLRFKHELLQDAVYGSLLLRDRAELHRAIAEVMERNHAGREIDICDQLALHYEGAGDAQRAAHWCMAAGDKAFAIFAIEEARHWHERALRILLDAPASEAPSLFADTVVKNLETLCWQIEYPAMAQLAEQHLPRIEQDTGGLPVSRVLSWMGDAYINTGKLEKAGEVLRRSLSIAVEEDDAECIAYAKVMLLWLRAISRGHAQDESSDITTQAAEVLDFADQSGDEYLRMLVHHAMAIELSHVGHLDDAMEWATRSIEQGHATDYPPAMTWALVNRAFIQAWQGDHDAAVLDSREANRHAESKFDRLMTRLALASALVLQGSVEEGLRLYDDIAEQRKGLSMISTMYWPDIVHGIGVVSTGEFSRGMAMLSACAERFRDLGHHRAAAQALLFLGKLQVSVAAGDEHCYLPVVCGSVALPVTHIPPDAADNAQESLSGALDLARDTEMIGITALALDGLARLARLRSDHARAAGWAEEARAEADAVGWPHPVGDDSPAPAG
jgi:class 3 adenylate cyclase/tetratricopeptide (TPR) repeat protein